MIVIMKLRLPEEASARGERVWFFFYLLCQCALYLFFVLVHCILRQCVRVCVVLCIHCWFFLFWFVDGSFSVSGRCIWFSGRVVAYTTSTQVSLWFCLVC